MANLLLKLPDTTYAVLKGIAERETRSIPNLVRHILNQYLATVQSDTPTAMPVPIVATTKPIEVKVASVRKPVYNDVHPDDPDEDIDGIDFDED